MSGKLFRGGVPTRPDVDLLMKISVEPGTRIDYATIEDMLGIVRGSSRFRTVTQAWRRRLFREQRLQVEADGAAFVVLTAAQAVSAAATRLHRVGRAAGRTVVRVEAIDPRELDDGDQKRHFLLRRHAAAALDAVSEACRAIAPPRAISGRPNPE